MRFQIGDVVHLIDGIDYNGNSLTYTEGVNTEIIGYEKDQYCVRDFHRPVEGDEIQKLIMTNAEKCKKYENKLSLYNRIVFIKTGSLTFEKVTIQYYSFEYEDFIYIENKYHLRTGRFWFTLLDAYKVCYEEMVYKMRDICKITTGTN